MHLLVRVLSTFHFSKIRTIENASSEFNEGTVGAGTGMICYSLKGGIGSASRRIELNHGIYTMGVLVLSKFWKTE
ncbi:P1 family peptidase [Alkalihalobacillus sp. BA299]|uniref:P1 family peptidase n=1 Tax=Alkalihalobacillus sp. BA299 TaxID=2815938 RepID=UPI0027DC7E40|nr:P1 family peptidase [Alkalihalobacillus sp. BA299]